MLDKHLGFQNIQEVMISTRHVKTFPKVCIKSIIRPSLLDSSFNVTEILKIVMWDAGIIYYPLFSRKNNTCSCALFKINCCHAGRIYLSLDTDKMRLLLM